MIEWSSFLIVAAATWVSAVVVITLFSVAVRMRAVHVDLVAEGQGQLAAQAPVIGRSSGSADSSSSSASTSSFRLSTAPDTEAVRRLTLHGT
jgi:hypothetical protein